MENTEFKSITREEYNEIKKDILNRYNFVSIKRNNQQYSLGGFNLTPKDLENGFTPEQIERLCTFLKSYNMDNENLIIQSEKVYGEEHGDFSGTKIKYMQLRDGFNFLMRRGGSL